MIGLGESGLAMARWARSPRCARHGARQPRVAAVGRQALLEHCPQATLVAGAVLARRPMPVTARALHWSPGLSPLTGAAAALYRRGGGRRHCRSAARSTSSPTNSRGARADGYRPKVIAITGTNGKTTVTQLVAHLCREAGLDARSPATSARRCSTRCAARDRAGRLPDVWVLELSSFQLALAAPLRAR